MNNRQIPEIVNEPAQPHQQISTAIRSCVDDDIRSIVEIWDGDDRLLEPIDDNIRSIIGG